MNKCIQASILVSLGIQLLNTRKTKQVNKKARKDQNTNTVLILL